MRLAVIGILHLSAALTWSADDAAFKPRLVEPVALPVAVRPGGSFPLMLRFINEGAMVADADHRVFVHFEPAKECRNIAMGADHEPTVATTQWTPGREVIDGPLVVHVGENVAPGIYHLHVGVFGKRRYSDAYAGTIRIAADAPAAATMADCDADEVARRRSAWNARVVEGEVLEGTGVRLRIDRRSGAFTITDKATQVAWESDPFQPWFGQTWVKTAQGEQRVPLTAPQVTRQGEAVRLAFRQPEGAALLTAELKLLADGRTVAFSYAPGDGVNIARVRLLSRALWMTEADRDGAALLPMRAGLSVPAVGQGFFQQELPTSGYEGCHMQMLGFVKGGAAALMTWDDIEVTPQLERLPAPAAIPGSRVMATSMTLWGAARSFRFTCLGRGDTVTVAQAYRAEAKRRGLVQTWDDKIRRNPAAEKLIGATNIKLWSCLSRSIDPATGKEKDHHVSWTFDEAAAVAEHLRKDLGLDRVLFTLGGWIHRGYDNQHPDILPTAPECGGDAAFADAMKRIAATGFTPCLHDNYQDIYRDSPSWDEKWVMRNAKGDLAKGGVWAGGQAYLTCSRTATELARRPQNLPAVRTLTGPIAYFIDTTYAAGLQTCHASGHPLTWADDLRWKCELSDYARDVFGLFGSEDGREWAVPHADFFEGLTGVSGGVLHGHGTVERLEAEPIPLFEMVYHDCIAAYGKYGYAPEGAAEYVLRHLLMGRPINVHNMPPHRYWTGAGSDELPVRPAATAESAGTDAVRVSYAWTVEGAVTGAWSLFVHIVDDAGKIVGQDDHKPPSPITEWRPGVVTEPVRTVRLPVGAQAPLHLQVGFFKPEGGHRARLKGRDAGGRSYRVGTFIRQGDGWRLDPVVMPTRDAGCFVRGDGGWSEGLHSMDRYIKNAHEVLAPLNAITARRLLDGWRHLDATGMVCESRFGDVRAVANLGTTDATVGSTVLPPFGLLVESPMFVAFHAKRHAGIDYPGGALFTLTSCDGQPIDRAKRIRVFHGFGPAQVAVAGKVATVAKESVIER